MAHIPYGYTIENGRARVLPEQAAKLNGFFNGYLSGLSVKEAREKSGVELCESSLKNYMRTGIYAGTDYYPAIVPEGTFERVMEEMKRKTRPGHPNQRMMQPVHTKFLTIKPEGESVGSAAEAAEAVYNLITPSRHGRTFMNKAELAMLRKHFIASGEDKQTELKGQQVFDDRRYLKVNVSIEGTTGI